MSKQKWKAGNMIYPLPAVMISCGDKEKTNIVTVAWTGTICTNPAMTYISLRKSRYSYDMIKESGYFVINLTSKNLVYATDFCGVRSGRDLDKFKEMGLTPSFDEETGCAMIEESPVSVVCRLTEIKELGSHDLFLAEVLNVYVDEAYMDEKGKFHLNQSELVAYSHGSYFTLGEELGSFGYSVRKKEIPPKKVEIQSHKKANKKPNEEIKIVEVNRRKTKHSKGQEISTYHKKDRSIAGSKGNSSKGQNGQESNKLGTRKQKNSKQESGYQTNKHKKKADNKNK